MTFALWQQSSHLRWTWVPWKALLHCQSDKSLVNRTSGSILLFKLTYQCLLKHVCIYHRRQKRLRECIPRGYALVESTGDGNCLFNSVSIGLIGDESLGTFLRLITARCTTLWSLHGSSEFCMHIAIMTSDSLQLPFNTISDFPTTRRSWDGYPISCICKHWWGLSEQA